MILWLNPVGGLAGDMLLAALLDLGAPADGVRAAIATTGLQGWRLDPEQVRAGALRATRAGASVADDATERRAAALLEIAARAEPAGVAAFACRAVSAIAAVEGAIHGVDPDDVHLHEIGGLDTVVDTVGVAAALHLLDVTEVHCAPLPLGAGTIGSSHGRLPAPAPATVALLAAAGAPVRGHEAGGETVTPTAAALLTAAGARYGPVPPMTLRAAGYGAGTRTGPDGAPSVVQALLGAPAAGAGTEWDTLVLLETNLDDVPGEILGHVVCAALAAGAADAWVTPAVMKKSRPGHVLHVLADAGREAHLRALVLAETGSLGVRRSVVERLALPRHVEEVEVGGHRISVKHGPWGAKPEYADVAAAAAALGLPLRVVAARALGALPHGGRVI